MSDFEGSRPQKPAFQIVEPNPMMGSNAILMMNAAFSRSICDLILNMELSEKDGHLYAFAKGLRRYYYKMSQMYQSKAPGAGEEIVAESLDKARMTG